MEQTFDVVVVGGGLAGLAAAATARASGASTLIIDARNPGGRARTTTRDGYTFNLGGHALYMGGPGIAVLRRLGVEPRGGRPPIERFRIEIDGDLHLLPATPTAFLRSSAVGARGKAQLARLMTGLARIDTTALADMSTADWVASLGLRDDAALVLRVLLRTSTYTADFDRLSADAAVMQLQFAAARSVSYLHGGWHQLIEALAGRAECKRAKVLAIDPGPGRLRVATDSGEVTARTVVIAAGDADAARRLLPGEPPWPVLGEPVMAACLDAGVSRIPAPGYVMGTTAEVFATTQGPPAQQAPPGHAVLAVIKYGIGDAARDRFVLERHLALAGVRPDDVIVSRFLARMTVTGPAPHADAGGLPGRPRPGSTGVPGVFLAGDWVGEHGLLADAALASGEAAAKLALAHCEQPATMVP